MLVLRKDLKWNKLTLTQRRIVGAAIAREEQLGELNSNAHITKAQAFEVKQRLAQGEKPIPISEVMEISANIVYAIRRGDSWNHVLITIPACLAGPPASDRY